ncbi:tautomerase family protein [Tatumella citrea]|uniref:Decarboxylase n=1 Tax=Tatumella citrea TaxID=53336 RepID=A0A1Y0L7H5_TATCI|nr:tautomerase family protein [Tatumella citrea]ARU93984.1 decarboxylase [Tatumella citrea]ARU98022.1 decarboxylase [Tatumella citrea]
MPVTRISTRHCYSREQLQTISDVLHRCLVAEFEVPPDDRFQIINQLTATEFSFDTGYLSDGRSEQCILFEITAGRPRSRVQKQQFYRMLTRELQQSVGIRPDDVMIIITFNSSDDWSFSRGVMLSEVKI